TRGRPGERRRLATLTAPGECPHSVDHLPSAANVAATSSCLGEHTDATPTSPSIRISRGCGSCPALCAGERRYWLRGAPDEPPRHPANDGRDDGKLWGRRGAQVVSRGPHTGEAGGGRCHRTDHSDR